MENKRPLTPYNLFMKQWMSKRPTGKPPKEWMKQIGKKWRATKSLSNQGIEARLKACEERLKAYETATAAVPSAADLISALANHLQTAAPAAAAPAVISAADLTAAAGRLKKTAPAAAAPAKKSDGIEDKLKKAMSKRRARIQPQDQQQQQQQQEWL
jgi:hypothetical protein